MSDFKLTQGLLLEVLSTEHLPLHCRQQIDESVEYLVHHELEAVSDEVPDKLLEYWISEWTTKGEINLEQAIENYERCSVFGRIFSFVILMRQRIDPDYFVRTRDADPQALLHAAELVNYVLRARKNNIPIPKFDIFDVARYDELMGLSGKTDA